MPTPYCPTVCDSRSRNNPAAMADDRLDKLSEIHNGGLCNYKGSKEELVTLFGKISRIFWYFKKKKAQTEQFL